MNEQLQKKCGFRWKSTGLVYVGVLLQRLIRDGCQIPDGELDLCLRHFTKSYTDGIWPREIMSEWQTISEKRAAAGVQGENEPIATYEKLSRMIACSGNQTARDLARAYDHYAASRGEMKAALDIWTSFDLTAAAIHNEAPHTGAEAAADPDDDLYALTDDEGEAKPSPVIRGKLGAAQNRVTEGDGREEANPSPAIRGKLSAADAFNTSPSGKTNKAASEATTATLSLHLRPKYVKTIEAEVDSVLAPNDKTNGKQEEGGDASSNAKLLSTLPEQVGRQDAETAPAVAETKSPAGPRENSCQPRKAIPPHLGRKIG